MSRIGKTPIKIPEGVTVKATGRSVSISGPKGDLKVELLEGIEVDIEGNTLDFAEKLRSEDIDKALHGLPEDHKHCAELAVRTLNRAIKKYKDKI